MELVSQLRINIKGNDVYKIAYNNAIGKWVLHCDVHLSILVQHACY
jgi:hypothetical protein